MTMTKRLKADATGFWAVTLTSFAVIAPADVDRAGHEDYYEVSCVAMTARNVG
jgi:hypothetical protein